jgi:MFS family permease
MRAPWRQSPGPTGAASAALRAEAAPAARKSAAGRVASLRTFEAFGDRSFRWFMVSMLAQFSSMHMQMVVNPWLVYELTGSYAKLGAIALASAIPGLILGFPGGVVADRASKKLLVQGGQAVNALSTLAIALLIWADQVTFTHLMIVGGIQGGVWAVMGPARQALVPEIVGASKLTNAVALNMAGMNFTRLGVPALGGFLIAWIGAGGVYALMAGLIFVAMFALIPVRPLVGGDGTARASTPWGGLGREVKRTILETGEGIAYMRRDATVFAVLTVNFFIVLMSMPYMQMMAGFVKQVLDGGPEALGLLLSVTGVGSLVGSLAIASMPNRGRGLAFLLSALILGFALLAFSISTWLWVTALIMIVIGLGQAGRMSLSNILLMAYTEPSLQGRVMSVYMMEFSLVSFGTFLVGVLAELVGVQWAIGSTAVSLIVISGVALLWVPRVRRLP